MKCQRSELEAPIQSLPFSDTFKAMAEAENFKTLGNMLRWPVSALLMHNGFTYHHYHELRRHLQENNLLTLLKV